MHRIVGALLVGLLALSAPWVVNAWADDARGPAFGVAAPPEGLGARRLALCIGIDGYGGARYKALRYAAADARALAETFTSLGYETTLIVDGNGTQPELLPTYRNLDDRIHAFCRESTQPGDTLIVTFSGHGDVLDGQSVLIPIDYEETGRVVTVGALFDALRRAKAAKKLLVIDACRSARRDATRTLQSGFLQSLGQAESLVVLSGCGADQFSFEDDALGHGRLTTCLVDGLGGQAFGENREFLFGHELWGYVERTFHERGWAEEQSPTLFGTWDARVRFDVARRDIDPPPAIASEDREIFDLTLERAVERSRSADHTAAVKYCTTALRILPRDGRALARRAYGYLALGYADRAFQDAQVVLERDPDHPLALVIQTWLALLDENHALAHEHVKRMRASLERVPERWRTEVPGDVGSGFWMAVGYTYGIAGRSVETQLEAYRWAMETEGAPAAVLAQVHLQRGILYSSIGRYDDAAAEFRAVIETDGAPSATRAYARFDAGLLHAGAGREGEARAAFESVLAEPNAPLDVFVQVFGQLGALDRAAGREADALRRFETWLDRRADEVDTWCWLSFAEGLYHVAGGDRKEAAVAFGRTVERSGAPPVPVARAWGNLGTLRAWARRLPEALEALDACLAIGVAPVFVHARALNQRGVVLEGLDRPDESATSYERVLDLDGAPSYERAEAALRLALLDISTGHPDEAHAWAARVLAQQDVSVGFHLLAHSARALAYAASARAEEARRALDEAAALRFAFPGFAALGWVDRARVLDALGDAPESAAATLAGTLMPLGGAGVLWMDGLGAIGRHAWGAARDAFKAALESGPAPAHVRFALGEVAGRHGAQPESIVLDVWVRRASGDADLDPAPIRAYAEAHPESPLAELATSDEQSSGAKADRETR